MISLLTLLSCTLALGQPSLTVDPHWPQKPAGVTWAAMSGVDVDANDNIYLFTRSQPAVQVYRPDGTLVRSWSPASCRGAHHVRVDPEGNVWLPEFRNHVLQKYSPQGKLLLTLGEFGKKGSDAKHFDGVTDVAVLPSGDLFVSDGYQNRRVAHFDRNGRFVSQWGTEGTGPGQFALPHSIVADRQNRLYVADRNNARIQVFDTQGKLLAMWDNLITPWGLFMTKADELWVCGSSRVRKGAGWMIAPPPDQMLMKLSLDGKVLFRSSLPTIRTRPGMPGEVDWVHAVAADSQGNLYLGDIQGQRAQKFAVSSPRP
jgi:sugar lactone lactonase YvrE